MKSMILWVALAFTGSVAFAGINGKNKKISVDKAMTCFVKSLKPEAFNAAWTDGGKAEFMRKVKGNENMPVLGDQLADLVSKYMSDAAFTSNFLSKKSEWLKTAAAANTEQTVARAFWDLRQNINPAVVTEKGAKMMAKHEGGIRALAS